MDFRLIEAALHSALSPTQRLVLVAMADCKWDDKSVCNPSISTLAGLTGLTTRAILKALSELKQNGVIALANKRTLGRKGESNAYGIALEKLAHTPAKVGERGSHTPAKVGERGSPKRRVVIKKECVQSTRAREGAACAARTHTAFNSDDVFADGRKPMTAETLADDCGVPLAFVKDRLAEWKRDGWRTTQDKPITRQNIKAHLRAWWRHEKNPERYTMPEAKTRKYTAKDWALCRERCAHCAAHGCGKGMTEPPDKRAFPEPPEECQMFEPLAATPDKRKKGKRA